MPATARTTLAASTLIVGVTAVGLVRVIFHLRAIQSNLAATTSVAQTVADLTGPVPERLTSVNNNLRPVREFCDSI